MPSTSATSRCSSPSTSCSTNAARQPSGSSRARARDRSGRSPGRASRWLSRVRQHRRVVEAVGQLAGSRRAAADVVENLVRRQPIQPRAERRLAPEALELAVRREEDLLQQILGIGGIAQHPEREAEQPARVRPVQLLERAELSPAAALDQRQVGVACRWRPPARVLKGSLALRRRHTRVALPGLGPVSRRASSLITVKTGPGSGFSVFFGGGPSGAPENCGSAGSQSAALQPGGAPA